MEIILRTISKQCSTVINCSPMELPLDSPILQELHDRIYDLYPTLDISDYNLYWRYSKDTFYQITDYLSYITALTLMLDRNLFLVLNDCDEYWEENEGFLRKLDQLELDEERERRRDLYDVVVIRKGEEGVLELDGNIEDEIPVEPRTDSQIISYALRKFPVPKYFTSDLYLKSITIGDFIKGWPKFRTTFTPLKEEVVQRASPKKPKTGKDSKKQKKK